MKRVQCLLYELYLNARYFRDREQDEWLMGHDFEYTDGECDEHWHMVCMRCGMRVGTEISPDRVENG